MPVAASAMAKPIHKPAMLTVVSFCSGDSGIVVIAALRLTAIAAVRMVVPIRSSMTFSFMCIYTYRDEQVGGEAPAALIPDFENPKALAPPRRPPRACCRYG